MIVAILAFAYAAHNRYSTFPVGVSAATDQSAVAPEVGESRSDQVSGTGTIIKILPDDNQGDRHQRFLLRLPSGKTLLIVHNIDIASRVSSLNKGDIVEYKGEYVWNEKGGLVHWTHHDPSGRHPAGWLKHAGQTFE